MATVAQVLEYVEHQTDLDVVAITDHEDVLGGLRARELAASRGYRVEVIPGAEITTLQGHVLGLFIEATPRPFRRVESTLEMIHGQDGLAIAPHPLSWMTRSISERTLDRLEINNDGASFDGIETANPSPAGLRTRARAIRLNAERWHLPETGSSDAHHLAHIGTGWTLFAGSTAEELRVAFRSGTIESHMTRYPGMREVGVANLAAGLAWGYTATPRKLMRRPSR